MRDLPLPPFSGAVSWPRRERRSWEGAALLACCENTLLALALAPASARVRRRKGGRLPPRERASGGCLAGAGVGAALPGCLCTLPHVCPPHPGRLALALVLLYPRASFLSRGFRLPTAVANDSGNSTCIRNATLGNKRDKCFFFSLKHQGLIVLSCPLLLA